MAKPKKGCGASNCISFAGRTGVRYAKPLPVIESLMAELLRRLPGVNVRREYEVRNKGYYPQRTARRIPVAARQGVGFLIKAPGIVALELYIIVDGTAKKSLRLIEKVKEALRVAYECLRHHHFKVFAPNFS